MDYILSNHRYVVCHIVELLDYLYWILPAFSFVHSPEATLQLITYHMPEYPVVCKYIATVVNTYTDHAN